MAIDFYEAGRISGTMIFPAIIGLYVGNKIRNFVGRKIKERKGKNEMAH